MFIRALHLSNYKSFKTEQTVEFGKLNLIIGKNGSGKSNLLGAIACPFLMEGVPRVQYDDNEEVATVRMDIDNHEQRFPLGRYFSLSAVFKGGAVEYFINDRSVNKDELRGMLENAGFNNENIVRQGQVNKIAEMTPSERYRFIATIAGIARYEESREQALKYLNEENEDRITSLLDKLEVKMRANEEYRRKSREADELRERKAEVEFDLAVQEIRELNEQIDSMMAAAGAHAQNGHDKNGLETNEGLIELELKECRDSICKSREEIDEIDSYLRKVDPEIVAKIHKALAEHKQHDKQQPDSHAENGTKVEEDGVRQQRIIDKLNIYHTKVAELQKRKKELTRAAETLREDERTKYTEIQARKFWDTRRDKQDDPADLHTRLSGIRRELGEYSAGRTRQHPKSLADLIADRKRLWITEKALREEHKLLTETESSLTNKMLYLGKQGINIYEDIKNEPGVCGTVFSLLTVPDDLLDAFDAVTRNSLFWVVVESDEVAARLLSSAARLPGRVTFLALNIVARREQKHDVTDADDKLIRLCKAVKCGEQFRCITELICKDFYVCSDLASAVQLASKYSINTVTLDGDVVSRSGSITGGYEQPNSVLKELRHCRAKIRSVLRKTAATAQQLDGLNDSINRAELEEVEDGRGLENLRAMELFLTWRISGQPAHLPSLENVEMAHKLGQERLATLRQQAIETGTQLDRYLSKKERLDSLIQKVLHREALSTGVDGLRTREQTLIDQLYSGKDKTIILNSASIKQTVLIDKRANILKKFGLTDVNGLTPSTGLGRDALLAELKRLTGELKKYYGFDRRNGAADPQSDWRGQFENIRACKARVIEFIERLDQEKENTLLLTFSMISSNYSFFHRLLSGADSELRLGDQTVDVLVDGQQVKMTSLSGGQKCAAALSLIFAVQKNDPSPFYLFDEVDANLDPEARGRLYAYLKSESAQCFVISFKEEALSWAERFYGVAVDDKASFVGEIDRALAEEAIRY